MELTLHGGRHGGFLHYVCDPLIGGSLAHYGEWAEEELYLLSSFIRPGDTVLDVGANIGTHSIAFSRFVGPTGRVISIDGQRRAFELLIMNRFLNAAENLHCIQAIVGKQNGMRMVAEEDAAHGPNLACVSFVDYEAPRPGDASTQEILIPRVVLALDEVQLPRCELIKIDAEAMELEVMLGATRTIEQHRPVIYFEQTSDRNFAETFQFLKSLSYEPFWHVADPFNRNNLRGNSKNIFGGAREVMVLALPKEGSNKTVRKGVILREIMGPVYNPPCYPLPEPGWALPENAYRDLPPVDLQRIKNLWKEFAR